MIIIAGHSHQILAAQIAQQLACPIIVAHSQKFEDQEWRIQVQGELAEQTVIIVQSTNKPANDHLMELLLLADTAKRAGAQRIVAAVPYFGYSRQDRPSYNHGPISASLVARLIEAAGIDRVITLDLHSRQAEGFFKIGVQNIDALPLFLPHFKNLSDTVVVSPDVGGLARAKKLAEGLDVDLAVIDKSRDTSGQCAMHHVIGNVANKNCILIDDIIDTGGTLCMAAGLLRQHGAKSVSGCVTHGVMSGNCLEKLSQAAFDNFYITDSITQHNLPSNITLLSTADILAQAIGTLR